MIDDNDYGYSATVCAELHVQGATYDLAEVAVDYCVLRHPRLLDEQPGTIVLNIDGHEQRTFVEIVGTRDSKQGIITIRQLPFRRIVLTEKKRKAVSKAPGRNQQRFFDS